MSDVLKNPSSGDRGQVMKSSKGKLGERTPVTYFLVDTSHHVKVVSKHTFSIVGYSKTQGCGFAKADALRLKKD